MTQTAWNSIKQSKSFYVSTYRRLIRWTVIMLIINVGFVLGVAYFHFTQPIPDYYATNGITAPVQLAALSQPNNSNVALLPPDPINEEAEKVIPQ